MYRHARQNRLCFEETVLDVFRPLFIDEVCVRHNGICVTIYLRTGVYCSEYVWIVTRLSRLRVECPALPVSLVDSIAVCRGTSQNLSLANRGWALKHCIANNLRKGRSKISCEATSLDMKPTIRFRYSTYRATLCGTWMESKVYQQYPRPT